MQAFCYIAFLVPTPDYTIISMPRYTHSSNESFADRFIQQHLPSPLQQWSLDQLSLHTSQQDITLSIKRDDLIHPQVSGNKWRKLVGNLQTIQDKNRQTVISFGGAYSNHLVALATLCANIKIPLVAIIRGEEPPIDKWNPRLQYLQHLAVELIFVSREEYRQRDSSDYQKQWQQRYPNSIVIPEGGTNTDALSGVGSMVEEARKQVLQQHLPPVSHWIVPVGSGGTVAGITTTARAPEKVWGVCVLKGAEYLEERVSSLLKTKTSDQYSKSDYKIWHDFHCGGYAKQNSELIELVKKITAAGLTLEPVYSGKLFLALQQWLANGIFPTGSHIVFIHTGGVWQNHQPSVS
jgi:1-aminocyclopropane-1-carboxylate deaminase